MHPTPPLAAALVAAVAVTIGCSDGPAPAQPFPSATASASAGAPIIRHYPGEAPGPPYYADLQRDYVVTDGGWVGIVFYRSPECVPPEFNLLDWRDRPAAFDCALTVEGEEWWHDLSAPPPFQTHERGLGAVPVYFVALSELQAAMADDVLTIAELQTLPSLLIGQASFLEDVVHNTSDQNHGHSVLVARGTLEDGRSFELRYNEKFLPETGQHVFQGVKISFE